MDHVKMFSKVSVLALFLVFASCAGVLTESVEPGVLDSSELSEGSSRSAGQNGTWPVRLLYGQPFSYSGGGASWDLAYFYVHVKNIGSAPSRVVSIHWNNGGGWTTTPMTLVAAYTNHSLYQVSLSGSTKEFVVKYESSAGTYWDNNYGANYKIRAWFASDGFVTGVVGGNVGLNDAYVTDYPYFTGTVWTTAPKVTVNIRIENLSFNKSVIVRYSTDGGASWSDVNASYQFNEGNAGGDNLETWKAEINTPAGTLTSGTLRFALRYKNLDTGLEYWDNDFTQDYWVGLAFGNMIR